MTTGFLLDTNIVSELRRKSPDPGLKTWWDAAPDHLLNVSVLTLGEIRHGVTLLADRDPRAAAALDLWLAGIATGFASRTIGVDSRIADCWGRLRAARPLPVVDGLLAATAIVHDLTLVTRNVSDVARTGARVLNPFSG